MENTRIPLAQIEDILDSVGTYFIEHYELLIVFVSLFVIMRVAAWVIYERLGVRGWKSLVPFYNYYVIFRAVDIQPAVSFLLVIPILNVVIYIFFLLRLLKVYRRTYFFIVGLILVPPLFACILAFGEGKTDHYRYQAKLSDTDSFPTESTVPEALHSQDTPDVDLSQQSEPESESKMSEGKAFASSKAPLTPETKQMPVSRTIHGNEIDSKAMPQSSGQASANRRQKQIKRESAMEFTILPERSLRQNINNQEEEKKLVSIGISIDMVKHANKRK